jgi:hypothetical protein
LPHSWRSNCRAHKSAAECVSRWPPRRLDGVNFLCPELVRDGRPMSPVVTANANGVLRPGLFHRLHVKALNAVESYDWATFLRDRLDAVGKPAPLAGIRRGGYQLVYDETPSDYSREEDTERKRLSLLFSIGLVIDEKDASVLEVLWDSPAFKAKLTEGTQLLAINGVPYSADVLKAAIQSAKNSNSPIELIVKMQDRYRVVNLDYKGGHVSRTWYAIRWFPHCSMISSVRDNGGCESPELMSNRSL